MDSLSPFLQGSFIPCFMPVYPGAPQESTGPRTEDGKAASSMNGITHGLFARQDFIRPNDVADYAELATNLQTELAPVGLLETNLVYEIRRAMWRLRRCGEVEGAFLRDLPEGNDNILDPMQSEADAKIQNSVDRARAHSHRLLHKSTAELRKLQTERQFRNDYFEEGTDVSNLGLCDLQTVRKGIDHEVAATLRQHKLDEINDLANLFKDTRQKVAKIPMAPTPTPVEMPVEMPVTTRTQSAPKDSTQTPRNAPCTCGSGQKFKRCCGRNAPAVLHVA
jgi:hypothetical protein